MHNCIHNKLSPYVLIFGIFGHGANCNTIYMKQHHTLQNKKNLTKKIHAKKETQKQIDITYSIEGAGVGCMGIIEVDLVPPKSDNRPIFCNIETLFPKGARELRLKNTKY